MQRSTGGGGAEGGEPWAALDAGSAEAWGVAEALPTAHFEYFEDTLSEEQLAMLDALVEMRIGFVRHDHHVRGASDVSFYCYRGRASPAQFPFLPTGPSGLGFGPRSAHMTERRPFLTSHTTEPKPFPLLPVIITTEPQRLPPLPDITTKPKPLPLPRIHS